MQQPLFNEEQTRDDAIRRVTKNAKLWPEEAFDAALAVIGRVRRDDGSFTTDAIWAELHRRGIPEPHDGRAMGGVVRRLVNRKHMEATGQYTPTDRPGCHKRPIAVYRAP